MAGYGSAVTSSFYQSRFGDGEIVRGFDLISSPYQPTGDANISYFITANPAAWNGTRIAAIASGYQNYRPLSFKIHYRPQIGSTSSISMVIGTVWQNTYMTSRATIEPSLVTSPGGTYLPCWQSVCSVVPLGRRLPQRMFPVRDPHFSTIPFSLVCRASEGGPTGPAVAMPGRIFIEYAYEFRNAIGGSTVGFQPSKTETLSLTKTLIYSGETVINGARYLVASDDDEANADGWIIDQSGEPSAAIPLFARLSHDRVLGTTTSGGVPKLLRIATINDAPITDSAETGTSVSLVVYTDDGLPA